MFIITTLHHQRIYIVGLCFLALCTILVSCESDSGMRSTNSPSGSEFYPTVYAPLSSDSLMTLDSLYLEANPHLCTGKFSKFNEWGFTAPHSCYTVGSGVEFHFEVEPFIEKAKLALVENSAFTGVLDTGDLSLSNWRRTHSSNADTKALQILFRSQVYQGLKVIFSGVSVTVDSIGLLSIRGNFYPTIIVPEPAMSAREAQETLGGLIITWYDFGGAPREYEVQDNSFCHDTEMTNPDAEPERMILPYRTDNGLEMRVVWMFEVGCENNGSAGWKLLVDVVSGEHLETFQMFDT